MVPSRALAACLALIRAALILIALTRPALADDGPPRAYPQDGPVQIAGAPETVFDWTADACEAGHFADLPVRPLRIDGRITLIMAHDASRRLVGPDFDNLAVDCDVIFASTRARDPEDFANYEWIAATYVAGDTIHALVHNEYQGNRYPECRTADYFSCWYNTITYARSDDGGDSFYRPVAAPGNLVANIPEIYRPDEGIFGAFSPSNIIMRDGYYHAFFKVQSYPLETQFTCLMRTDDPGDPERWRYWDGAGFNGVFADPYRDDLRALRATTCTPVALPEIAQMYEGVTWNTVLGRYILVGTSSDPARDPDPFGFYYALSDDLINWEPRIPLLEVRLPWRATGRETVYLYPTLIDHDSDSPNFETSGATAHLYFTRLNFGSGDLDRDLVRVPLTITAPD